MLQSPSALTSLPLNASSLDRLARLEGYLKQDSANLTLLEDAFSTALDIGQWERAERVLRRALEVNPDSLAWQLREGDWLLAQSRYKEAQIVLTVLQQAGTTRPELAAAVLYDLAFIEFSQAHYLQSVALLTKHMAPDRSTDSLSQESQVSTELHPHDQILQVLWLRSLHHVRQLERACKWVRNMGPERPLHFATFAVASLIAIDAADFAAARLWADLALNQAKLRGLEDQLPIEFLMAELSLALAARQADMAIVWADRALTIDSTAGRAWSGRAFALLLTGEIGSARADFARALQHMPAHIGTWHGQGWAQLIDSDVKSAHASFVGAIALDRNIAESHGALAVTLALTKQTSAAQQSIDRANGLDKNNLSARYAQALLNGEVTDSAALHRLAKRLLKGRSNLTGIDLPAFFTELH